MKTWKDITLQLLYGRLPQPNVEAAPADWPFIPNYFQLQMLGKKKRKLLTYDCYLD